MIKKILLTLFVFTTPLIVAAATSTNVTFPDPLQGATFKSIFERLFDYALGFGAVALTIMVVIAAYTLMLGQGKPEEIKKAKNTILWGIIGYVILLFAKAIQLVILNVLGVKPL